MKFINVIPLVLLSQSLFPQELPPRVSAADYIDAQAELQRLGPIDGVWEGMLRPKVDPIGGYREWPEGFPIRIEIRGQDVGIWFIEEGDRLEALPGDAYLIFADDGSALIDYVGGSDAFNEIWSISLNQVEPNKLTGFILRTVHNFAVKKDSPWRVFPIYSVASLERAE